MSNDEFSETTAMERNFQAIQDFKLRQWRMRYSTFAIAGVFLAALFTMSMWPSGALFGSPETSIAKTVGDETTPQVERPKGPPMRSNSAIADARTEEALESACSIDYQETQFSDVMVELSESLKLNFILHDTAIDDALTEEELVTIRVHGVSFAKALELLLDPFNAVYTIDEGVVVIVSKANMNDPEHLRLKMFDCKDLLTAFVNSGDFKSRSQASLGLTKLVCSMVQPDAWDTNGGEGRASIAGEILIVNQNESALRQISALLKDLRGQVLGESEKIDLKERAAQRAKALKARAERAKAKENKAVPVGKFGDNPFKN